MFSTFICILFKHTEGKVLKAWQFYSSDKLNYYLNNNYTSEKTLNRHFSLLNVNFAGACGYDFVCDGRRLVRAYLRRRREAI